MDVVRSKLLHPGKIVLEIADRFASPDELGYRILMNVWARINDISYNWGNATTEFWKEV